MLCAIGGIDQAVVRDVQQHVGLAAVGVVLVSGHQWSDIFRPAVLFALMAAAMWASYILLAARVSTLMPRLDGLAVGMTVATIIVAPAGLVLHGRDLVQAPILAVGLTVAVMSSVLMVSSAMGARFFLEGVRDRA